MIGGPESMRDMPDNDNNQVQSSLKSENIAATALKVQRWTQDRGASKIWSKIYYIENTIVFIFQLFAWQE